MANVLVVDDEIEFRQLCVALLTNAGYDATHAGNGEDAQKILNKEHFDLVITDFMMPGMNVADLEQFIKKKWPDMPVIAVTNTGLFESKRHSENLSMLGVDAMVEKSPRLNDLLNAVAEFI